MVLPPQTSTPYLLATLPEQKPLQDALVGLKLNQIRTPALVLDRARFAQNCANMHEKAKAFGSSLRCHVKTHKTTEGTRMQLDTRSGKTSAIVVSTMPELWHALDLVEDGTINDLLYALPLPLTLLSDLASFQDRISPFGAQLRVMIDHPDQVKGLEEFERVAALDPAYKSQWSCYVKINSGGNRAGLPPSADELPKLITQVLESPVLSLFGFYVHAGQSYASTCQSEAHGHLETEVECADLAGKMATKLLVSLSAEVQKKYEGNRWSLSVGSTPTAHSAQTETHEGLSGDLELHAGNYCILDLQQLATHLSPAVLPSVACSVIATIISAYPDPARYELMCDAGCLALSKEIGPEKGLGRVLDLDGEGDGWGETGWRVGRVSQEHGILERVKGGEGLKIGRDGLEVGVKVRIVPQHACITLAAYPFYYVVDSSDGGRADEVVDIWVPWKGW